MRKLTKRILGAYHRSLVKCQQRSRLEQCLEIGEATCLAWYMEARVLFVDSNEDSSKDCPGTQAMAGSSVLWDIDGGECRVLLLKTRRASTRLFWVACVPCLKRKVENVKTWRG